MSAVPLAGFELVYAARPAFWHELESLWRFFVPTQLCASYIFFALFVSEDTSLTSRMRRLTMLEFVVPTVDAYFLNSLPRSSAKIRKYGGFSRKRLYSRDWSIGSACQDVNFERWTFLGDGRVRFRFNTGPTRVGACK